MHRPCINQAWAVREAHSRVLARIHGHEVHVFWTPETQESLLKLQAGQISLCDDRLGGITIACQLAMSQNSKSPSFIPAVGCCAVRDGDLITYVMALGSCCAGRKQAEAKLHQLIHCWSRIWGQTPCRHRISSQSLGWASERRFTCSAPEEHLAYALRVDRCIRGRVGHFLLSSQGQSDT